MGIADTDIIFNRPDFDTMLVTLTIVGSGIGVMVGMVWKDFFEKLMTPARHMKVTEAEKWEKVLFFFIIAMVSTVVSVGLAYLLFARHKATKKGLKGLSKRSARRR